jgi:hypothetical protein
MSGRNNPSLEFVTNTLKAYPNLSADWLISGRGSMFRDATTPSSKSEKIETENLFGTEVEADNYPSPLQNNTNINSGTNNPNSANNPNNLGNTNNPNSATKYESEDFLQQQKNQAATSAENFLQQQPAINLSEKSSIEQIIVYFSNGTYRVFI